MCHDPSKITLETDMAYELAPGKAPVLVSGDVHFWLTIDGRVQHYVVSHEGIALILSRLRGSGLLLAWFSRTSTGFTRRITKKECAVTFP